MGYIMLGLNKFFGIALRLFLVIFGPILILNIVRYAL